MVSIDGFPHRPGGHCSSTAMRDILQFHGHTLSEEMVFGLGVGIGFVYYRHPAMRPPVYVGGRIYNLEEQLTGQLGIGMDVVSGLDDEAAWLAARDMLDGGEPVMVHADVYHLDYLRAKRHFSGHRIVLVGYDEAAGVAYVADNDRDSVQQCSLAHLREARASRQLPQPADNAFYRFDIPGALTPLEQALPPALSKAVRYNLRLSPERAAFRFEGAEVSRGMPGLQAFADELPMWREQLSDEQLSLACKHIYVSVEKGGTGYGGNFRRIYGRFLVEAAVVLDDAGLASLGEEFIAVGDRWTGMALAFKELSGDGAEALAQAAPVAREIAEREQRAFEGLEAAVAGLQEGEA